MSGKNLTAEQEKTSERIMIESGLKGAAIGLGIGAVATVLTFRRSPEFRALSRPLQSLMTVSSNVLRTGVYSIKNANIYL